MKWRFDERAFKYRLKNICSIFNFEIKVGNRWMSRGNEETIVWECEMKKKKKRNEESAKEKGVQECWKRRNEKKKKKGTKTLT